MKEKNNKGQSTIEFILSFTASIGFIFLFLKLALNYTNGYMVHHATFMASRAYLVGDEERYPDPTGTEGDGLALKEAEKVFKKNLPENLIPDFNYGALTANHPKNDSSGYSVFVGLWVEFTQAFSIGFIGGKDQVAYRSESFLGREPTRSESVHQVCEAIKSVGISSCNIEATLDDNGG